MKLGNRVTEKPTPREFFLVTSGWQVPWDNKRMFTLENTYTEAGEARNELARQEKNEHGYQLVEQPRIRKFVEVPND